MARPREFSVDDALGQAMQVFWTNGYDATSLHDLIAAMGISKSSFYDTFGSKHALYLSAMERYNETVAARAIGALIEEAGGGRAGIAAAFDRYIEELVEADIPRGCFVNNCAVEMAPRDGAAAARVRDGLAHLEAAFRRAVQEGQDAGEVTLSCEAGDLARYLTSSLNGLIVMAKAKPDRATLKDIARIALTALD